VPAFYTSSLTCISFPPCSFVRLPQKFGSSALTGLSAFAANLKEEAQRNAAAAAAEAALQKQVGRPAWAPPEELVADVSPFMPLSCILQISQHYPLWPPFQLTACVAWIPAGRDRIPRGAAGAAAAAHASEHVGGAGRQPRARIHSLLSAERPAAGAGAGAGPKCKQSWAGWLERCALEIAGCAAEW